MALKVFLTY